MKILLQVILGSLATQLVNGQGTCSNTCPPLNAGKEIRALCTGDTLDSSKDVLKEYEICYPTKQKFQLQQLRDHITVFSNYYVGCEAGLRESSVFAYVGQKLYNKYGSRVQFIQTVKGGGTCEQWASVYQRDVLKLYNVSVSNMPLTMSDVNYEIRDYLFTEPFKHPSYLILDDSLTIRHKFIGPCCGATSYLDCNDTTVMTLEDILTDYVEEVLQESGVGNIEPFSMVEEEEEDSNECIVGDFSEWSPCSAICQGREGTRFRWRMVEGSDCPHPVEKETCIMPTINCKNYCINEFGKSWTLSEVSSGFNAPRDVAFHPTPGYHLQNYSEGRVFHPEKGKEAWVVNGGNHSVSIVASLGTEYQTTIARRDRGYYHYMINGTALAFNNVSDSGRDADRDSLNYWAICNDNLNTYLETKEANYFMGPTLYDSSPKNRNLVNRLGEECQEHEAPCYFLHSDMLHEAPSCIGIVHDPEVVTTYGNVYWAFDTTGNLKNGQLVRFDFQQPHGPGSMDHSVAAIRRYVEVELTASNTSGVHAGMAIHETRRELFISVPGANKILVVDMDSGSFGRSAREEYPIYSNKLPSFEYSIWECVDFGDFASDISTPSGLAISDDRLFVAERDTGTIHVFDIPTTTKLGSIDTGLHSIGGLAFSLDTLYFVDEETNALYSVQKNEACSSNDMFINQEYTDMWNEARNKLGQQFSLMSKECISNPVIPDSALFEQVHEDTGYADSDPNVQSVASGMDESAALLANRTDCEYDSELNFDALLLGGYFCHVCLPEQQFACDYGGTCTNVQWSGYTCDNEYTVVKNNLFLSNGTQFMDIHLQIGVTYRFQNPSTDRICVSGITQDQQGNSTCSQKGPILFTVEPTYDYARIYSNKEILMHLPISHPIDVTPHKEPNDNINQNIESNEHKLSTGAMLGISLTVCAFVGIVLFGFLLRKQKHNKHSTFSAEEIPTIKNSSSNSS